MSRSPPRRNSAPPFGPQAQAALGLAPEPGAGRPFAGGFAYLDPRTPLMGARAILPADGAEAALAEAGLTPGTEAEYERRRIRLGVPAAGAELLAEKSTALECNLDYLGAVSWTKGCFIGQELTARMHHRKLVRKRLMCANLDAPGAEIGTAVSADGRNLGALSSVDGTAAIALIRLDRLAETRAAGAPAEADGIGVRLSVPPYADFTVEASDAA